MWESEIEGKKLTFHLAGINNQNFIMRDDETGTWWQQVSGEAMHGAFKGRQLTNVFTDEITFAVWKREHPNGRVLRPDDRVSKNYEAANWEEEYEKLRVVVPVDPNDKLKPRALIAGIVVNNQPIAYAMEALRQQRLILNVIDATPIFIALGEDNKSVRAFERKVEGRTLEFFVKENQFVDAETGSTWDFTGKAISGALAGKQLKKISVLKDYWFDWKIYHPDTSVYTANQ
ncbi:MAG: DUF3179 domain-containing protein [Blastocatellia bacterium]|nr:DUF3179 domain-containing protein [Blastocatellia bacterium]